MDISDYFVDPNPDGKEWIKRKIMNSKWELRRLIEEVEFVAEKYQLNKKYNKNPKETEELKSELKELLKKTHDLAVQIRDLS